LIGNPSPLDILMYGKMKQVLSRL